MRLAFLLFTAVAMQADDKKPTLPKEIQPIVELARASAPEFFAETIARLIETGNVADPELQSDLLGDAFAMAGLAREPLPLIAMPSTPPDTRELRRAEAARLHLDALSLESRILRLLIRLDPAKARELFEHVPRPAMERRLCEDPLIADPSPYYEMAAAIAASAFTPLEQQHEAHVQFLVGLLAGVRTPIELHAATFAFQSLQLTPPQLALMTATLAGRLETIEPDYRSFAISAESFQRDLAPLGVIAGRAQRGAEEILHRALRTYFVRQLTAPRCAPDIAGADHFSGQPPLTEEERRPAKRLAGIKSEPYFQSSDAKAMGDRLHALRFDPAGAVLSRTTRSTPEWSQQFDDTVRDVLAWNPEGSETDVFHQKATLLRALLQLAPPGEERDRLLNASLALIENSEAQRQSPAEWLSEVRLFLNDATADAGPGTGDSKKLPLRFRESSSPALALLARIGYFGDSSGTSK